MDPNHTRNREIPDIGHAPRNSSGLVEFSADLHILQPSDPTKGNGTILFEVVNRGKKGMLPMFNRAVSSSDPTTTAHFGDGMLLQDGYTLVWLGWQHDVPESPDLMRLKAPVAAGIKGLVRAEYAPVKQVSVFPLGDAGHVPYRPVNSERAVVTVREEIYGARKRLTSSDWSFDNETAVRLSSPAVPGRLYEVVYEASDPVIAGLGLAAIRDFISHLKGQRGIERAIGFGISQSAMVLRAFLYEGFNQNEKGARVFDAIFAHVAGARRSTFQRFTQPSRTAGPLRNASLSTTEQFPFADTDLLSRALAANVAPKIFYTNSSYEYWGSAASLLHTSEDGARDLELPPTTRMYVFAGGQHGPASFPPRDAGGLNLPNFNDYRWLMRALLKSLHAWVVSGTQPAPSVYPTLGSGTLVTPDAYRFRSHPLPKEIHTPHLLVFGPDYVKRGIITNEPPRVVRSYKTLVPQADADGNDLGGIRMPEVACAIAAYTGWNLRAERIGAPEYLLGNTGSYLPFKTADIEKRFSGEAAYRSCVDRGGAELARRGFLLPGDVARLTKAASQHWKWRMAQSNIDSLVGGR